MTSLVVPTAGGLLGGVSCRTVAEVVKSLPFSGHGSFSIQKAPNDSIGTFALTLANLVVGSSIRIETQAGALVEYRVAASATEAFTVPAYSPGSAGNDLRIKVRKGTAAPKYLPFSTLVAASVGAGSVYIAQVADPLA